MDEAGVLEGYVREGVFSNLAQCGNVTVERHIPPNAHATAAVKHLTTTCDIFVHMEVRNSYLYEYFVKRAPYIWHQLFYHYLFKGYDRCEKRDCEGEGRRRKDSQATGKVGLRTVALDIIWRLRLCHPALALSLFSDVASLAYLVL